MEQSRNEKQRKQKHGSIVRATNFIPPLPSSDSNASNGVNQANSFDSEEMFSSADESGKLGNVIEEAKLDVNEARTNFPNLFGDKDAMDFNAQPHSKRQGGRLKRVPIENIE